MIIYTCAWQNAKKWGDILSGYLKKCREDRGLTQSDVAEKLDISESYYSLIENGKRQPKMKIDLAEKLSNIFGVTIEYIMEQEKEKKARWGECFVMI